MRSLVTRLRCTNASTALSLASKMLPAMIDLSRVALTTHSSLAMLSIQRKCGSLSSCLAATTVPSTVMFVTGSQVYARSRPSLRLDGSILGLELCVQPVVRLVPPLVVSGVIVQHPSHHVQRVQHRSLVLVALVEHPQLVPLDLASHIGRGAVHAILVVHDVLQQRGVLVLQERVHPDDLRESVAHRYRREQQVRARLPPRQLDRRYLGRAVVQQQPRPAHRLVQHRVPLGVERRDVATHRLDEQRGLHVVPQALVVDGVVVVLRRHLVRQQEHDHVLVRRLPYDGDRHADDALRRDALHHGYRHVGVPPHRLVGPVAVALVRQGERHRQALVRHQVQRVLAPRHSSILLWSGFARLRMMSSYCGLISMPMHS